jgi:hypothetical protein
MLPIRASNFKSCQKSFSACQGARFAPTNWRTTLVNSGLSVTWHAGEAGERLGFSPLAFFFRSKVLEDLAKAIAVYCYAIAVLSSKNTKIHKKTGSSLLGMVRYGGINWLNPYLARDLIDEFAIDKNNWQKSPNAFLHKGYIPYNPSPLHNTNRRTKKLLTWRPKKE